MLATVTRTMSETDALALSVAVILRSMKPTLAFSGVPLKVLVVGLQPSQLGSAVPSAIDAL